uniref:Uncharacterized protein n=1 Tax=Sinocyclocheilus grahami TaxID=75366 RepID=A0A672R4Q3_SINGR
LQSPKSLLRELDVSNNDLQDSGVKLISDALKNPNCQLEILRLSGCMVTDEGCCYLASAMSSNPSHLRELDLSYNHQEHSAFQLRSYQNDPDYALKILKLNDCDLTDKSCSVLATVLESDTRLKELNMNNNNLQDSGVKLLCTGLKSLKCKLEILRLNNNRITAEGCAALISAFNSNPSNLKVLNLSENKLGNSGIEKICHLMKNLHCILEKLKLNNCELTEESCSVLATVLSSKTILKEMNLNNSRLLDSGVKEICEGLKNPVCELNILKLNNCELTEESCSVLATVLSSKTILKEMNLNNSRLLDSGVKEICEGLKNPVCELNILKLRDCDLTQKSCSALAAVLRSNTSLKELDMSNNNLQDSGVKKLQSGLENTNCTLKKLRNINFYSQSLNLIFSNTGYIHGSHILL